MLGIVDKIIFCGFPPADYSAGAIHPDTLEQTLRAIGGEMERYRVTLGNTLEENGMLDSDIPVFKEAMAAAKTSPPTPLTTQQKEVLRRNFEIDYSFNRLSEIEEEVMRRIIENPNQVADRDYFAILHRYRTEVVTYTALCHLRRCLADELYKYGQNRTLLEGLRDNLKQFTHLEHCSGPLKEMVALITDFMNDNRIFRKKTNTAYYMRSITLEFFDTYLKCPEPELLEALSGPNQQTDV